MTLVERAHAVKTRDDLLGFLHALREDFSTKNSGWTNDDLGSFLDAMVRWSGDMNGYYANRGESVDQVPPWRVMTDILMGARVYE